MKQRCWFSALPGVIAVLGWVCLFTYALLRALAGWWWMIVAVLVITLLAGILNATITIPGQAKKGGWKKLTIPPIQHPGTH